MTSRRILLVLLLAFSVGCSEQGGPDLHAETHFMESCTSDEDCGDLSCICNTCTLPCTIDEGCFGLGGGALCSLEAGECSGAESNSGPVCTVNPLYDDGTGSADSPDAGDFSDSNDASGDSSASSDAGVDSAPQGDVIEVDGRESGRLPVVGPSGATVDSAVDGQAVDSPRPASAPLCDPGPVEDETIRLVYPEPPPPLPTCEVPSDLPNVSFTIEGPHGELLSPGSEAVDLTEGVWLRGPTHISTTLGAFSIEDDSGAEWLIYVDFDTDQIPWHLFLGRPTLTVSAYQVDRDGLRTSLAVADESGLLFYYDDGLAGNPLLDALNVSLATTCDAQPECGDDAGVETNLFVSSRHRNLGATQAGPIRAGARGELQLDDTRGLLLLNTTAPADTCEAQWPRVIALGVPGTELCAND